MDGVMAVATGDASHGPGNPESSALKKKLF